MFTHPVPKHHLKFYALVLIGMIAVIASALAFQHIGGYQPCKLCLGQREPWYVGIPIAFLAIVSLVLNWSPVATRGLMAVAGLVMLYSFVLAVHHAGVEWAWWEGPNDCGAVSGGLANNTNDLLKQLEESVGPSCTEATLRVLGLSFAGWNALASIAIATLSLFVAFRKS
jgi:disulfide bond formation protein DsbB